MTATVGLFVPLHAKDDQDKSVEEFLLAGRQIVVEDEPLTLQWYALKYVHSLKTGSAVTEPTYAIFDTFAGEEGRNAHLTGEQVFSSHIRPRPSCRVEAANTVSQGRSLKR